MVLDIKEDMGEMAAFEALLRKLYKFGYVNTAVHRGCIYFHGYLLKLLASATTPLFLYNNFTAAHPTSYITIYILRTDYSRNYTCVR